MFLNWLMKRLQISRFNPLMEISLHDQSKRLIAQTLLAASALLLHLPDSHAFGSYGENVDAECLIANGTQPYSGNCDLCHDPAGKNIPVEPEWSAYHAIGPLAFCDQAPDSLITSPTDGLTVNLGASVTFSGNGSGTAPDPEPDTPLTYSWDFGGAAENSSNQNPTLALNHAGTYTVSFIATDSKGRPDPTPASVNITVIDPNANQAPNGVIETPTGDVSIDVGDAVEFFGSGSDPENNTPLSYHWNFGGGATNTNQQNPTVTFDAVGIYTVTFTVTDSLGLSDPTPATRTVSVNSSTVSCSDEDNDLFSPEGGVCGPVDCDDFDASINPGAIESCGDHVDNDCNGDTDRRDAHCNSADCPAELLKQVEILKASWDNEDRELTVKGRWPKAGLKVLVSDALTGEVLGATRVKGREHDEDQRKQAKTTREKNHVWKFELDHPAFVPCRVRAEIDGHSGERDVAYAPANCSGKPPVSNNLPIANDDHATTIPGKKVKVDVLNNDNDLDEDRLRIIVFTQAEHGVVTKDDERLVYKPKRKFRGTDEFTYTISDGHGGTASATVNVEVHKKIKQKDD